ncbi:MAG TPA: glycosyltransferase [Kofleriaceae bacterium]|nr:glycosyltransferase [Kofleriaceae bacterium]
MIVRSYNRLHVLPELLELLLAQDHDDFEIVIIDQSTVRPPDDVARVDALARDPRVRLLHFAPLGGPGARNAGVRASRGDLLVFIDDDDLPDGTDWLRKHEANFSDPNCLGVTGMFVGDDGKPQPYANMKKANASVLSFNLIKWQRAFPRADQKKRVESLMGGNAAIPRTTLERFGLWDECTPCEDEPSLAYRINQSKRADEYLLFDPVPRMRRRKDVPGGMDKRLLSGAGYAKKAFTFFHNIVAHYFPLRFVVLYPAVFVYCAVLATDWIINDSRKHQTLPRKIAGSAWLYLTMPPLWIVWLGQWWYRRLRYGELPRYAPLAPRLAEGSGEVATHVPAATQLVA